MQHQEFLASLDMHPHPQKSLLFFAYFFILHPFGDSFLLEKIFVDIFTLTAYVLLITNLIPSLFGKTKV
ncbi:hypothetical protein GCM10007140_25280 [Priestia taiwanensis]|uniref:Uncharacterized protein n=1 Tax=Priestia taiwanensis TaxID=1347902 RepID=A0A917AVW5_9BACI|nr:hypothetical protein GCM10007140_25280 [Priestia taiwanensis]